MWSRLLALSSALSLSLLGSVAMADPPVPFEIAVTVDDVPWVGPPPTDGRAAGNAAVIDALRSRGVPAVAFVVCSREPAEGPVVRQWLDAGFELGNHHLDHSDLSRVDPDRWLDGARACHAALTGWIGKAPRYFRYPFLHNGPTAAIRDRVRGVLTGELGQAIARVSVDNHEWKIAELYGLALAAGDAARADALAALYVPHMLAATAHARATARAKFGRDIRHVLLLHQNTLNAHHLGRLLDALAAAGARFVTLERALADPIYAAPDAYVGTKGIAWAYRVAPVTPDAEWRFENESWAALRAQFGSAAK